MNLNNILPKEKAADPGYQAYQLLHLGFSAALILFGLDKFFNLMVDWTQYLAPIFVDFIPASSFMRMVGVVEIIGGLLVFYKPCIGAYVVAAWLLGIFANLLLIPGFFDVALRDFGLLLGALSLARLSHVYASR